MRIAFDAMGGDGGPAVVIPGAIQGARRVDASLLLAGRTNEIEQQLAKSDLAGIAIEILEAPDVIGMDEHPAQAIRRKSTSSTVVALEAVRSGRADAVISAGNTGAVMANALLVLGRIAGVERPAIAAFLPTASGMTLMLDLGAVTDPRPSHLVQFARMGSIYTEKVLHKTKPTVALLSNGEEPTKGNQLVQEVFPLLQVERNLNFVGNIEGNDILKGDVDIIVTDGFTGNVALKVAEGTAAFLSAVLREEVTKSLPRKAAAAMLRPAFASLRTKMNYARIGAAPLLGVNGTVMIAHGRSSESAIASAVERAAQVAQTNIVAAIRVAFSSSQVQGEYSKNQVPPTQAKKAT